MGGHAQVIKYRVSEFVVSKYKNMETNNKFEKVDWLFTLDNPGKVMKLFTPVVQRYDIISFTEEKDSTLIWGCVDNGGVKCEISMFRSGHGEHSIGMMILWTDKNWILLIDPVKE
jgi:hypothetical protein